MPYIVKDRRAVLDPKVDDLFEALKSLGLTLGDFNYVYTKLTGKYVLEKNGPKYQILADARSPLRECYDELTSVMRLYEKVAIEKNGDVDELIEIKRMINELSTKLRAEKSLKDSGSSAPDHIINDYRRK